ncbi:MAG: hypothetical protein AAFU41_09055 [Pseudomonadota bacterium]
MKGRITREHDARQGYDGVYFEGGSAVTDADLNASFDAQRQQIEMLQRAWIGPAGSPDDGWKVTDLSTFNADGQDWVTFDVQAGHYGLDGNLLYNPAPYAYDDQDYALSASLMQGFTLPVPTIAEVEGAEGEALYDAVVLDVREVAVRVTEDSELDEVAMRSDPATRTKYSPKVRTFRDVPSTCAAARADVLNQIATPNGTVNLPSPAILSDARLRVQLGEVPNVDNPCAPEQATGYFGRLNHTIKVMLTDANRFVWGYQNGEGLHRATMMAGDPSTLRLITPFDDSALFPVSGQIVEVCTWDMALPNGEKTAVPLGQFHALSEGYLPQDETIVLNTALSAEVQNWYNTRLTAGEEPYLFLRFWEPAETPMAASEPTGMQRPLAQTGVLLDFLADGRPGDQWTFSLRVNANDKVFPKRMLEPGGQPPEAIERYADLLALIHWTVEGGEVVGHIHDCRRRIRPLWKQKGCCTFNVGDGITSFGDFDRIEDALAELPHEGGKICLLPGQHRGGVTLRNRENITISGCGERSVILPTPDDRPLLTIEDCENIALQDIMFMDSTGLAIAGARNRRMRLSGIRTRGRGSAVSLVRARGLQVRDCTFLAEAEPAVIPPAQFSSQRPLVVVGGVQIEVRDNTIRCEDSDLALQSLGGLQITSNSENVWIENNVIYGGLGHGITLGHLERVTGQNVTYGELQSLKEAAGVVGATAETTAYWHENGRTAPMTKGDLMLQANTAEEVSIVDILTADAEVILDENNISITDVAFQGCIGIIPFPPQRTPEDDDENWEEYFVSGEIEHLHIIDNEIRNMGGSGIASPAWNVSTRRPFGTMQVIDLVADRNHIENCALVAVATTLNDEEIQEVGFGGIALEYVEEAKISNNVIEDIGLGIRTPAVGIYLREATDAHIHDNVLRNIGRVERNENRNIDGIAGGIIVDQCWPVYGTPTVSAGSQSMRLNNNFTAEMGMQGPETQFDSFSKTNPALSKWVAAQAAEFKLPRGEALRIQNNAVAVNFGMALDLRGSGSIQVAHNQLSSLAARPNPARPRLALSVSVVNTELEFIELIVGLIALLDLIDYDLSDYRLSELLLFILILAVYFLTFFKFYDVIRFESNQTYLEDLSEGGFRLSICAVVSPFDVHCSNNVMKSLHSNPGLLTHLLGAGIYSMQCFANRFDTRPRNGVYHAAITMGFGNSTSFNHASQPIRVLKSGSIPFSGNGNLTP